MNDFSAKISKKVAQVVKNAYLCTLKEKNNKQKKR
jgi:hypothetical protein